MSFAYAYIGLDEYGNSQVVIGGVLPKSVESKLDIAQFNHQEVLDIDFDDEFTGLLRVLDDKELDVKIIERAIAQCITAAFENRKKHSGYDLDKISTPELDFAIKNKLVNKTSKRKFKLKR